MIDKTGESDTFAKFLSGSSSPEMKSDGVSERLAPDERGACRRGVGVAGGGWVGGGKRAHLWRA